MAAKKQVSTARERAAVKAARRRKAKEEAHARAEAARRFEATGQIAYATLPMLVGQMHAMPGKRAWEIADEYMREADRRYRGMTAPASAPAPTPTSELMVN